MKLAIVICFRDEERYLPRLFQSIDHQTEPADEIVLVDDGSRDGSPEIAQAFAHHPGRLLLRRSRAVPHGGERDRLMTAPELAGFYHGAEHLSSTWDIVTKMDGDLELPSTLFAEIRKAMGDDPHLGIAGAYLSIEEKGRPRREHNPPYHVRGPNKFYRRECFEAVSPLPAILGWDTIDELRARRGGWTTRPIAVSSGDVLHLRPTGRYDGRLRAYRRWGRCAWGYGAHPAMVLAGTGRRATSKPYVVGGISYAWGWAAAAARGAPRADAQTRAYCRAEDVRRIRRWADRLGR